MSWKTRINYSPTDRSPDEDDLNAPGLDLRTWGGNVEAAGYALSNLGNVTFASGSGIVQDAWTAPTYENSWADLGGSITPVGFRINRGTGNVECKGAAKGGTYTDATTIFTVPASMRPATMKYVGYVGFNGTTWFAGVLSVASTGAVKVYGAGACAANSYIVLQGLTWGLS